MDHRAPQYLFDEFVGATEEKKSRLRKQVVDWMRGLDIAPGDTITAPNPASGEPQSFVHQPRIN